MILFCEKLEWFLIQNSSNYHKKIIHEHLDCISIIFVEKKYIYKTLFLSFWKFYLFNAIYIVWNNSEIRKQILKMKTDIDYISIFFIIIL